jgi:hypothetical protein
MATTTNFGWETPDDTDLVKDGAAAMRTLGNSIDTSFVDLKGGTTGQVLAKASATDLDYTWTTPEIGDITAITATSPLTGGGTTGSVTVGIQSGSTTQSGAVQLTDSTSSTSTTTAATPNSVKTSFDLASAAVPKSTVTTAGDVIYATGSGAVTRLGIGTAGQVLSVNSGATAPEWKTPAAGSTFVGCAAFRSGSTQSIPTGTNTALTLPSEEYDSDGFHSTSSNTSRFTIPTGKGGKYLVNAFVQGAANFGSLQQLIFLVNGSVYSSNGYNGGVFADQRYAADWVTGYSSVISLVAADYLEVALYHLAAGAVNAQNVRVSITYLGA